MRTILGLIVVLVVLALLAAPRLAAAAPDPTPEQMQAAKGHFERAQALYNAGKYDESIAEYKAAHDAAPLPAFLFNLGQAYRLKGDKRQAVESYRDYLKVSPGGPGAVEAQSHVAVLGREIDAEDAAARERASAEERTRAIEEARRKEREAARAEMAARPVAAPEAAPRAGGRTLKIAGLATAAGGAVLAGVGVYFGMRASSLSSDLADLKAGDEWDPSLRDDGKAAQRNMLIFTALGGAAVVTGGVLYYLGVRADRAAEAKVAVTPTLAPGLAGLLVHGSF